MQTTYKLTIPGEFPSLNQFINACRTKPILGNKMKQESQRYITLFLAQQLKGVRIEQPISIDYKFYCKSRKRDLDNISSYFHKVLQDSLVDYGTIKNDGWNNITGFSDSFFIDKVNPRVEISINLNKNIQKV